MNDALLRAFEWTASPSKRDCAAFKQYEKPAPAIARPTPYCMGAPIKVTSLNAGKGAVYFVSYFILYFFATYIQHSQGCTLRNAIQLNRTL